MGRLQNHQLYDMTMPRGEARRVGNELGYADGSIPRRWCRPPAEANNLFTGEISPIMKAGEELLAHDRTGPDGQRRADILLYKLVSDLARQRARIHPDNERDLLLAVGQSYHALLKAFTIQMSNEAREAMLYEALAVGVRVLVYLTGDDGAGSVPLRMVDDEQAPWLTRLWRRLISDRPFWCRFGFHRWEYGPTIRRCRRCPKIQAGVPRR